MRPALCLVVSCCIVTLAHPGKSMSSLSLVIVSMAVTRCLGVRPDPGFRFGVGVPESGVGWDGASASGSLRRLDFRVWYLARDRGHVAGCNNEVVDSNGGDVCGQES